MKKRTIQRLSLSALALFLIGGVGFLLVGAVLQNVCTPAQITAGNCAQAPEMIPVFILFSVAGILIFIAWLGALIRAAKMHTWGWFLVVLFFDAVGLLIYALAGPPDEPPLPQAGAWPGYPPFQPPASAS